MNQTSQSKETHNQRLEAIANYLESLDNPVDAEFIRQLKNSLHDAYAIAKYFREKYPAKVVPGATNSIGNIAIELKPYSYKTVND